MATNNEWRLITRTGQPPRRAQSGFTLVSLTVNMIVSAVALTGAWLAYNSMQVQWHIMNAERMMDQYAHAVMQELTNDLSWSWGGEPTRQRIQRNTTWRFVMDDLFQNIHGSMQNWKYPLRDEKFLYVAAHPTRGILMNDVPPEWSAGRRGSQYLWTGSPAGRGRTRSFDRRDRMTLEGLFFEYNLFDHYRPETADEMQGRKRLVRVTLLMHYTYRATALNIFGLFPQEYVRERMYQTQIAMRNWDVEENAYRDRIVAQGRWGGG